VVIAKKGIHCITWDTDSYPWSAAEAWLVSSLMAVLKYVPSTVGLVIAFLGSFIRSRLLVLGRMAIGMSIAS
jgi:hypothetical protein